MELSDFYNEFRQYGYTWKFSGKDVQPTYEDFTKAIASMIEALRDEPSNAQIEMGHLIVKKVGVDTPIYDVYVHGTTLTPSDLE